MQVYGPVHTLYMARNLCFMCYVIPNLCILKAILDLIHTQLFYYQQMLNIKGRK